MKQSMDRFSNEANTTHILAAAKALRPTALKECR